MRVCMKTLKICNACRLLAVGSDMQQTVAGGTRHEVVLCALDVK